MEKTINPNVLPSFFKNVEIISSANADIQGYQTRHAKIAKAFTPQNCEITAASTPILLMDDTAKKIYRSNNFAKIKELQNMAQKDLEAVHNNISTKGAAAWTKVRSEGKEFYMSWSETGSMWAMPISTTKEENAETQQMVIQIGTYSKSSKICGIQSYNLTLPTIIIPIAVALIVAVAISGIIAQALGFAVTAFALLLTNAAAALGFSSFSFTVPPAGLTIMAVALVFIVVFIGLTALWNWLNRKYTIRLQIYNWDDKNSWRVAGDYCSNAIIAGKKGENIDCKFTLNKKNDAAVLPPGFSDIEILDNVCYYGVIIWENDNTFMEGCSMALSIKKGNTEEGFMWAFDCPRFSNNKHAGDNVSKDPKEYHNNCNWKSNPLNFEIQSTSSNTPVSFSLNALSGASDNLYEIKIDINKRLNEN